MYLHIIYCNEALITLETWTTLAPYNTSLLTSELLRAYAGDCDSRTQINIVGTEDEHKRERRVAANRRENMKETKRKRETIRDPWAHRRALL